MPMTPFENMLMKALIGIALTCSSAFAWYSYTTITANTQDISELKAAIVGINTKLDLALKDIEFHHKGH